MKEGSHCAHTQMECYVTIKWFSE